MKHWVSPASHVSPLTYHCGVIEGACQHNQRVRAKFRHGDNAATKQPVAPCLELQHRVNDLHVKYYEKKVDSYVEDRPSQYTGEPLGMAYHYATTEDPLAALYLPSGMN